MLYQKYKEMPAERDVYSFAVGGSLREAVALVWALNDRKGFHRWRKGRLKVVFPQL